MRSRAHLGHPRAAGLCADDRAIRSGPHCSLGRHEAGLHISPDRDQQLTSEGDDGDTLDAPGGGAGLTLGWDWLTAVGVAPLIVATAPCLIMCALGLCMMGKGNKAGSEQPAARLGEPATRSLSSSET